MKKSERCEILELIEAFALFSKGIGIYLPIRKQVELERLEKMSTEFVLKLKEEE